MTLSDYKFCQLLCQGNARVETLKFKNSVSLGILILLRDQPFWSQGMVMKLTKYSYNFRIRVVITFTSITNQTKSNIMFHCICFRFNYIWFEAGGHDDCVQLSLIRFDYIAEICSHTIFFWFNWIWLSNLSSPIIQTKSGGRETDWLEDFGIWEGKMIRSVVKGTRSIGIWEGTSGIRLV